MNKSLLAIALAITTATALLFGALLYRTRSRVHEAERYVASGLASWKVLCIDIASHLERAPRRLDGWETLAAMCVSAEQRGRVGDLIISQKWAELSRMIDATLTANRLPLSVSSADLVSAEFPAGYQKL